MTDRNLQAIPARLWPRVAGAPHRLLLLDYDGTLAPFRAERAESLPPAGVLELLDQVARSPRTTVAVVSGRPVDQLVRLLGALPITLVGEHGWEERGPDGRVVRHPLDPESNQALDRAERAARERGWVPHLERKRAAIVLHTRGLPDPAARDLEDRCAAAWRGEESAGSLVLDRIDGGIELRARARNKGTAVRALIARSGPGAFAVYVGDDVTDEDAFEAVEASGLGIRVGGRERPSRARSRLPDWESLGPFLEAWRRAVTAGA